MRARKTLAVVLLAATTLVAQRAQAFWLNELGRYLGLGWSDGYHAGHSRPGDAHPWRNHRRAARPIDRSYAVSSPSASAPVPPVPAQRRILTSPSETVIPPPPARPSPPSREAPRPNWRPTASTGVALPPAETPLSSWRPDRGPPRSRTEAEARSLQAWRQR